MKMRKKNEPPPSHFLEVIRTISQFTLDVQFPLGTFLHELEGFRPALSYSQEVKSEQV